MSASTKKPLQVRMGRGKGTLIVGSMLLVNKGYFEISRQALN